MGVGGGGLETRGKEVENGGAGKIWIIGMRSLGEWGLGG